MCNRFLSRSDSFIYTFELILAKKSFAIGFKKLG